jgi:hypothetical protein
MLQTVASCCKHFFCSAVIANGLLRQVTGNWFALETELGSVMSEKKNTSATQM